MIDKRINYRFGGAMESRYGGGNRGSSSDDKSGGDGAAARQADAQKAMQETIAAAEREQAARNREQAAQRSREEAAQRVAEKKAADEKAATVAQLAEQGMSPGEAQARGLGAQHHGSIRSSDLHAGNVGGSNAPFPGGIGTVTGVGYVHAPPKEWYGGPDETESVINPFEQPGARTAIPTTPVRTRIQDERAEDIRRKELANIALQTDKSLIDISDPSGQGRGIMSSFADMGTKEGLMSAGKNYAKKAAINYGLQKLGLGFINPILGLASMFGFDPVGSLMAKMPKGTGTKTIDTTPREGREEGILQAQAPKNVIEENIQKFSPEQLNLLRKRYAELQGVIESGEYMGQKLNNNQLNRLADISKQMEAFLVDPQKMMAARGGLARLHG